MKLTRTTHRLATALQLGGYNKYLKGAERLSRSLFPLEEQSGDTIDIKYRGHRYVAFTTEYVDWQVLSTGSYEPFDMGTFSQIAKVLPQATCLDIGANIGHHSFVFATLGWTVHAFEPNPSLLPKIRTKTSTAGFDKVTVHNVALGDKPTELLLSVPTCSNSGTGTLIGDQSGEGVPVKVCHADGYLDEKGINKIDIVKIDVQGFEQAVLLGLAQTLQTSRPIISVEIGPENRGTLPTLSDLENLLPADYAFARNKHLHFGLMRLSRFMILDPNEYETFEGNLFCLPREREATATLLDR